MSERIIKINKVLKKLPENLKKVLRNRYGKTLFSGVPSLADHIVTQMDQSSFEFICNFLEILGKLWLLDRDEYNFIVVLDEFLQCQQLLYTTGLTRSVGLGIDNRKVKVRSFSNRMPPFLKRYLSQTRIIEQSVTSFGRCSVLRLDPLLSVIKQDLLGVKNQRLRAQSFVRGNDKIYRWTQQMVYLPFVLANRAACMCLAKELSGADMVLSLERGGSYLADQLLLFVSPVARKQIINLKIRKPHSNEVDEFANCESIKQQQSELKYGTTLHKYTTFLVKRLNKKSLHMMMLIRTLEHKLIALRRGQHINVVIVETLVGGASTNLLIKGLAYLKAKYKAPLKVRMLLHRHTLHQLDPINLRIITDVELSEMNEKIYLLSTMKRDKTINISNFSHSMANAFGFVYTRMKAKIPKTHMSDRAPCVVFNPHKENWPETMRVVSVSGCYLVNEDVTILTDYDYPSMPLLLFGANRNRQVYTIQPGIVPNTRNFIQLLVAGAFDLLLMRLGFEIPSDPTLLGDRIPGFINSGDEVGTVVSTTTSTISKSMSSRRDRCFMCLFPTVPYFQSYECINCKAVICSACLEVIGNNKKKRCPICQHSFDWI